MLEAQDQIDFTLDTAGEILQFSNGQIKGIPGHLVYNVQSFDSPYDIKKQDFDFQVSNLRFTELGIQPRDCFTYNLANRDYRFEIESIVDDLTGWFNLSTTLLEVLPSV